MATLLSNNTTFFPEDLITQEDIEFHFAFYKVTVPVLYGLITLLGLVGNLLVVFVILSNSKMRSTVNLLLLNLAVSDLLLLTVCVPFVTYHYAADTWDIAEFFCKLWQFVLGVTVYVTMYTLVAISVVRFLTIVYAHKSRHVCTNRNTLYVILTIWSVMLVANIPLLFCYKVKQYDINYKYCSVDNGRIVSATFFTFTYVVPLCLISTLYLLLMRFLHTNRKRSSLRHSNRSMSDKRGKERTVFASRILLVVVAVFAICWLPLHVHLIWTNFGSQPLDRGYQIYRVMCHCLAYANSCMNPVIYNYVSKDFRQRFRSIWTTCGDVVLRRNRHDSNILNTYDYKNEVATWNGGASSTAAVATLAHSAHPRDNQDAITPCEEDVLVEDDQNGHLSHNGSTGSCMEMLYVTKHQDNGVPVTDL